MSYEAVLIVPIYCTLSRALAILKIISSEQLQYVHCSGSKFILPLLSLLNVQKLPRVNKYCSILHYSTGGYCVRTVKCTHADFLHDLQMICFRSDMQNRTTFVNSKAILDMKKWELRICHEIQKHSLCNDDSKYIFNFFFSCTYFGVLYIRFGIRYPKSVLVPKIWLFRVCLQLN